MFLRWRLLLEATIPYTNCLLQHSCCNFCQCNGLSCRPCLQCFGDLLCVECTKRRKKSNVLLSLLAVTDLVVGAIVYPLFIASLSCRISGQCDSCKVDSAAYFLLIISCVSSLFHLVLIALDRFLAIRLALRYKALVTTRKITAGTVVAWTMAFVVSFSPVYTSSWENYVFLLSGAIPVVVICSCYASVYFASRKHSKNIQAQLSHSYRKQNKSRRDDFKAAKTTFIVYASSSVILIVPAIIAQCIKIIFIDTSAARISKTSFYFTRQAWLCTTLLLNSLSNPLIYSYRTQELRKAIRKVLNRLRNRVH